MGRETLNLKNKLSKERIDLVEICIKTVEQLLVDIDEQTATPALFTYNVDLCITAPFVFPSVVFFSIMAC